MNFGELLIYHLNKSESTYLPRNAHWVGEVKGKTPSFFPWLYTRLWEYPFVYFI